MALGATRGRVSRMVATSAGWLVSVGFLLGAPTAFWSTRSAARSVENLPAGGAVPIASAAAALIAVAFIAVYVPTRRATRVEPVDRTTRGIGCAEAFCWLRSVTTPQDGDVVSFGWYPGLGDDQR